MFKVHASEKEKAKTLSPIPAQELSVKNNKPKGIHLLTNVFKKLLTLSKSYT